MMHFAYWVVAGIVASMVAWISTHRRRKAEDLPELLATVELGLWDRLNAAGYNSNWEDEELWKALGGWAGLRRMWRDAGIIVAVFAILATECPEDAALESRRAWWAALYLRYCFLQTAAESAFRKVIPIPRMQAQACIRLYCDLHYSLDAVLATCSSKMATAQPTQL